GRAKVARPATRLLSPFQGSADGVTRPVQGLTPLAIDCRPSGAENKDATSWVITLRHWEVAHASVLLQREPPPDLQYQAPRPADHRRSPAAPLRVRRRYPSRAVQRPPGRGRHARSCASPRLARQGNLRGRVAPSGESKFLQVGPRHLPESPPLRLAVRLWRLLGQFLQPSGGQTLPGEPGGTPPH